MPRGTLYIVATPIGNLGDMTTRALDTLRGADLILCEDTRVSRPLLTHFKINTPIAAYHQHSTPEKIKRFVEMLGQGKNLAVITDAGTPGIADPGGLLVAAVLAAHPHIKIEPIPGPSALTAALSICGFNAQEFIFLGWPPHKKGRQTWFNNLAAEPRVIVFYESVYRVKNALERLTAVCPARGLMVARELTKKFETVYRGDARSVLNSLTDSQVRGEFVVILSNVQKDTRHKKQ